VRVVEYEIDADKIKTIHKVLVLDTYYHKEIEHAGIKIKIISGWQKFKVAGREVKARILREWQK
jgi:hypothetical protein